MAYQAMCLLTTKYLVMLSSTCRALYPLLCMNVGRREAISPTEKDYGVASTVQSVGLTCLQVPCTLMCTPYMVKIFTRALSNRAHSSINLVIIVSAFYRTPMSNVLWMGALAPLQCTSFYVNILDLCLESDRPTGSTQCLWWWEQPSIIEKIN